MAKICLNMIVKNEAVRLERCFDAVRKHIACAVIVDTGSTDETPTFIKEWFEKYGIPYELHHVPFENFEQARNAAICAAYMSELEFDWFLFDDADMELVVERKDFNAALDAAPPKTAFNLVQKAGGMSYLNTRLVRRDAGPRYVGVTHEYLDCPSPPIVLDGVWFNDHADGANRAGKFDRDIELLRAALENEPNNSRYWFYLAQSHKDKGEHAQAADCYKKCVSLGGWDEQVWYAQYQYAHCLKDIGDEAKFLKELLIAYDMRPQRLEPLYDLATHFRHRGKNNISNVFSLLGLSRPPSGDGLFVSDWIEKVGLRNEFSITGYYDPKLRSAAKLVANGLAIDKDADENSRHMGRSNLFWYIEPLATEVSSFTEHPLAFTAPEGWTALNPSVWNKDGELWCIVRTVNYVISETGHYMIRGDDGSITNDNPITTRNYLLKLSNTFVPEEVMEIQPPEDMPAPVYGLVRGFEDMRLFSVNGALKFNACVREMNPEGYCEQAIGTLAIHNGACQITNVRRMLPTLREHEKNWAPMVDRHIVKFMYRLGRTVATDGTITDHCKVPMATGHISGGSQLVKIDGNWLALVHDAQYGPNGQRYYMHRFALHDSGMRLLGLTLPFSFRDRQIEFAAGMTWHPDRKRLVLSYGIKDKEAAFATVDANEIMGLFNAKR